MAYRVTRTEHGGPKKGRSFWGRKAEAKHQSSRVRRRDAAAEIRVALADVRAGGAPPLPRQDP